MAFRRRRRRGGRGRGRYRNRSRRRGSSRRSVGKRLLRIGYRM